MIRKFFSCGVVLVTITTCCSFRNAAAQATASINDFFRYGTGEEVQIANSPAVNKHYFEEQADGKVFIGNVLIGFRYQLDDPTELYNQSFDGLRKRYIEYRADGFYVRAGNTNALFGRGLSLNMFENRSIYYDSELDGLKMGYRTNVGTVGVDMQALAGEVNFTDLSLASNTGATVAGTDTGRLENYRVQAAEIGFTPKVDFAKQVRLGLSWVHTSGILPSSLPGIIPDDSMDVSMPGMSLDVKGSALQWYLEYAAKRTDVDNPLANHVGISYGGAVYSSLAYNRPGFGAVMEYKNYHFDLSNPNIELEQFHPQKALPFQNAPILFKEQSYTLATRVQHSVNFNDEVGFQFDGFYSVNENLILNFNMAASSTHNAYGLDLKTGNYLTIGRSNEWLPTFNDANSPFYEIFAEVDYTLGEESDIKIAFDRNEIPSTSLLGVIPERSMSFPMIKAQIYLQDGWGLNFDFENQWLYNPQQNADTTGLAKIFSNDPHRVFSQLISAGFSKSPYGGLTAIYEWSTQTNDISGRRNWFLLEGTARVGDSNTLIVSVGSERGGIRCSNGICRTLNSFSGWRLTFASRI